MSMRAVVHGLARREPHFAVPGFGFRELAVRVARMVRHTFVRRLGDRAGGDHQKRERNTHRSTHWHCIAPLLAGTPSSRAIAVRPPCQSYWDGRGNADQCLPGLSPTNRVGEVGRSKAKQAKTPVSTLPLFFFCTLEADCGVQVTRPQLLNYLRYSLDDADFTY